MTHLEGIHRKIHTSTMDFLAQLEQWNSQNEKIVFTNGCFDILHQGHVVYLAKAAELGTKLVLGLNTDSSVRRLKGENRPINLQNERALLLAALGFVDAVILFSEDTPYDLIKAVQPDILVKGADYEPHEIVGYDIVTSRAGEIKTITLEEGFSTTNVVDKIQKMCNNG